MRFSGVLLLLQLLFFSSLLAYAQTGAPAAGRQDSLQNSVRQTAKKNFDRWKDSMEAVRIKQNLQRDGKPLDAFLQEMKEKEQAHRRQLCIRVGLGALFLLALAVGLARRRNR